MRLRRTGERSPRSTAALRARGIFGGKDLSRDFPELGQSALYCVTEVHTQADVDRLADALGGGGGDDRAAPLPRRRLGRAARDGARPPGPARHACFRRSSRRCRGASATPRAWSRRHAARRRAGAAGAVRARGAAPLPAPLAGDARDDGHQPLRHLHDEVQPARSARRSPRGPSSPSCTRTRTEETLQGVLEIVHGLDADPARAVGHGPASSSRPAAAPTPRTPTPASPAPTTPRAASSAQRDEVITTIQAHPCNAATAAAAGFKVDHAAARGGRLPVARRAARPPSRSAPRR